MKAAKSLPAARYRRTRADHHTERAEDYVEIIAELIESKGEARVVELSKQLGVSHVTVNRAVARLKDAGLVTAEPYRSIFLTKEGLALAESCQERHRLVLDFLNALGVPEDVAILDAEGIEHHVSEETLRAFSRYLEKSAPRKDLRKNRRA